MAKIVAQTHITGDKGVASFHLYCASHKPYILWRPEAINDFGIDGEVELTSTNSNNKIEATGQIIKVQIKSTLKGSYIHKETNDSFEFKPSPDDIDYWNKHNLGVILVIYDDRTQNLYARKIVQVDLGFYKMNIPLVISKTENLLVNNTSDFIAKFAANFRSRVDFGIKELLASNIHKFSKLPRFIYSFNCSATSAKEILDAVPYNDRPIFYHKPGHIYTIIDPNNYPAFCKAIDYNSKNREPFKKVLDDMNRRTIAQGVVSEYFKSLTREKKIAFNKEYKRYYFYNHHRDFKERIEYYNPKSKRKNDAHRTVVAFKQYKTRSFYRHLAFETKYLLNDTGLYLVINPQYLFTSDGRTPLEDKSEITALTNYLTSREFNQQVLNHTHFIFSFLASGSDKIMLSEIESSVIELQRYWSAEVPFGIPFDDNTIVKDTKAIDPSQQNLFD